MEAVIDVNALDNNGKTALDYASKVDDVRQLPNPQHMCLVTQR